MLIIIIIIINCDKSDPSLFQPKLFMLNSLFLFFLFCFLLLCFFLVYTTIGIILHNFKLRSFICVLVVIFQIFFAEKCNKISMFIFIICFNSSIAFIKRICNVCKMYYNEGILKKSRRVKVIIDSYASQYIYLESADRSFFRSNGFTFSRQFQGLQNFTCLSIDYIFLYLFF